MVQLYDLPLNILLQVVSYLDLSTTFSTLTRVSKSFYSLIFTENFVPLTLLNRLIGNDFPLDFFKIKDYGELLRLLQQTYRPDSGSKELPFYAFKTNTGCDDNNPNYFFHHVFKPKPFQSVCSKDGSNFLIQGILAYNYYEPQDVSKKKSLLLNSKEIAHLALHMNLRNERTITDLLKSQLTSTYEYEIPYEPLPRYGIIRKIKVSRTGNFSCPLKTLMLYVSNEKIEQDDPLVNLIGSPENFFRIRELYTKYSNFLPEIHFTNLAFLRAWAEIYTPSVENSVNVIVFKNSVKGNKAKPMIWVQFNSKRKKMFEVDLNQGNLFSGTHVLLKMINCEDMRLEYADDFLETNIDINYVSLKGSLL